MTDPSDADRALASVTKLVRSPYDAMLRRLLWGESVDESWEGVLDNPRNPLVIRSPSNDGQKYGALTMPSEPMLRTEVSEAEVEEAAKAIHAAFWNRAFGTETGTAAFVARTTWESARAARISEARAALQAAAAVRKTKQC